MAVTGHIDTILRTKCSSTDSADYVKKSCYSLGSLPFWWGGNDNSYSWYIPDESSSLETLLCCNVTSVKFSI